MSTWDGGAHTVAAAYAKLDANDNRAFRGITVQNPNASGGNSMYISFDGVADMGVIPADRAWTFGPNIGTLQPDQIWVKGTAADTAYWNGAIA